MSSAVRKLSIAACLAVVLLGGTVALGSQWIANSKHDLSAYGPGPIRGVDEERICVFCHTPHNAKPQTPLWNRFSPTQYYRVYRSSTTEARIDQPSGPSKMCLSCHDGSLAIGLVLSRPASDPITMTTYTLGPGQTNLTNDLSDDHPIGFRYDRALSKADPQLHDPQQISRQLDLGPHNEVHCTTCHDPHNNELGNFLRIPIRRGVLCTTCHKMHGWPLAEHAISVRNVQSRLIYPPDRPCFASLADNACLACHQVHGAAGRQRLLRYPRLERNCLVCHDGTVAKDIASVIRLPSAHHPLPHLTKHDPTEFANRVIPDHVECVDCHNPHAAQRAPLRPATGNVVELVGPLRGIPGVTLADRPIRQVVFEYQVCLRCHGDNPFTGRNTTPRVIPQTILRRQIGLLAASSHPFDLPRRSNEVPSLMPGFMGRRINCSDCHNSSSSRAFGGPGPNGPHGSIYDHILALRYETNDFTTESANAYALCYRCHNRASILGNESFKLHRRHIVNVQAPCNVCHDPHGVIGPRVNADHLINFDRSVVRRTALAPRIVYEDRGLFTGSCTLLCHGVNHVNFIYSPATPP
jgi:predicted CXXCH cytochrome family protein